MIPPIWIVGVAKVVRVPELRRFYQQNLLGFQFFSEFCNFGLKSHIFIHMINAPSRCGLSFSLTHLF